MTCNLHYNRTIMYRDTAEIVKPPLVFSNGFELIRNMTRKTFPYPLPSFKTFNLSLAAKNDITYLAIWAPG